MCQMPPQEGKTASIFHSSRSVCKFGVFQEKNLCHHLDFFSLPGVESFLSSFCLRDNSKMLVEMRSFCSSFLSVGKIQAEELQCLESWLKTAGSSVWKWNFPFLQSIFHAGKLEKSSEVWRKSKMLPDSGIFFKLICFKKSLDIFIGEIVLFGFLYIVEIYQHQNALWHLIYNNMSWYILISFQQNGPGK